MNFAKGSSMSISGNIASNQVWNVDTVFVTGNILIPNGITLSINPGCRIEMQGFFKWNINGCIKALGNVSDSIIFTINDTTNFWSTTIGGGGWKGMAFEYVSSTNDSTVFDYCIFEYVKRGSDANQPQSAIYSAFSSAIRISNSCFRNNYNALWCPGVFIIGSDILIKNNKFLNNSGDQGACIFVSNGSIPIIHNNLFYSNYAKRNGGAITLNGSNAIITNNGFFNNSIELFNCGPADGGGALRCTGNSNAYVANNVFANNEAGSKGGAIECLYGSNAIIENNTIVNNNGYLGGGGLYLFESSPMVRNNIFWGNTRFDGNFPSQIMLFTDDSEPTLLNNVIQDGISAFDIGNGVTYSGTNANNITLNPNFELASNGSGLNFDGYSSDWRLQNNSPCIDNGLNQTEITLPSKDYWNNARFSGSAIDIGAFEYYKGEFTSIHETTYFPVLLYPNPSPGEVNISSPNGHTKATIFSLEGKFIKETNETKIVLDEGEYIIIVNDISYKIQIQK
jgi:hypothetical protein